MTLADDDEHVTQPRVAAGALFFDNRDHLLLLQPSYKPGWEIPGGYVRAGETPHEAAAREVAEELGIDPPVGRLLVADWAPHSVEGDKMLFVFDGGRPDGEYLNRIRLDPDEVSGYAFHPKDAVGELLIPRLARRVVAAIAARLAGETIYLEHGRPLTLNRP